MMILSLYGINNIYYQPYLVDFSTNEILLDTIFSKKKKKKKKKKNN